LASLQTIISIDPKRLSDQMDATLDYSYLDTPIR
jgi:hypothetical protein